MLGCTFFNLIFKKESSALHIFGSGLDKQKGFLITESEQNLTRLKVPPPVEQMSGSCFRRPDHECRASYINDFSSYSLIGAVRLL